MSMITNCSLAQSTHFPLPIKQSNHQNETTLNPLALPIHCVQMEV